MRQLKIFKLFVRYLGGIVLHREAVAETEKELLVSLLFQDIDPGADSDVALIKGLIAFKDKEVRDILVPLSEMFSINVLWDHNTLLMFIGNNSYARYPVYENELNNIIGILHVKDVVRSLIKECSLEIKDLIRPVFFVPESKKISALLNDLKNKRQRMALVIDEYGEVSGLITQTDILEEVLSELTDYSDSITNRIYTDKNGWHHAPGTFPLHDMSEFIALDDDDIPKVETFAGYVIHKLGRIPQKGETVLIDKKIQVKVVDSDERKIKAIIFKSI